MLDDVRANAATVAASARFVRIQEDHLRTYAASLPLDAAQSPELDPATHYLGEPEATLAYLVTLDAINFGSGYFPHLRKRPGLSGYFTVASSLRDAWPLTVDQLRQLQPEDCSRLFAQADVDDADDAVGELMALFARALNDLGELVWWRYGGSFRALVDAAIGSAERLLKWAKDRADWLWMKRSSGSMSTTVSLRVFR